MCRQCVATSSEVSDWVANGVFFSPQYESGVLCCVCMGEREREWKRTFDERDYVGGYVQEAPSAAPGLFKSSH